MPVIDGLPVPESLRQITPRAPRPGPEEDPVDHLAVIGPPATARRIGRQEPPQALPLLISQVMTIQLIKHRTDLHDPAAKIHRTRPRGRWGVLDRRRCQSFGSGTLSITGSATGTLIVIIGWPRDQVIC